MAQNRVTEMSKKTRTTMYEDAIEESKSWDEANAEYKHRLQTLVNYGPALV